MEYVIKVEGLTKRFGEFVAVNDISFSIPKGSIFALLGPNGSGKTTTIKIICGVLRATKGYVEVLGKDVSKYPEQVKQNIGYVSQKFSLYEDLTIVENIEFYGAIYGLSKDEIEEKKAKLLKFFGFEGREKSLVGTLSGGMKQKLAFACATLHNPQILILDEPTAGVDPISRKEYWEMIRVFSQSGVTVLVTTHYMDEAERCDYVAFMFNGILKEVDTPANVKTKYSSHSIEDVFVKVFSQ
ncbi:ABC transporter related protein [Caldicellulosiruptor saccharolyticus DSM 8903]|uniref:ABC transporter related protein n=1 Tax=Caldicellulosiruptor saccharolyticus (strain ATCC 43494 / DSM 8903 / Tp8T 6331) TaxID=351627 RepID=A4XLI6_CALS8|nr:ABC transporter ATP-binding protein [Caldicellulosiruptor saccharolyticus]ABP67771.1 ABC transporter related protein [Caldicellulosiruptor saccharolyticus DSM 8903]